MFSCYTTYDVQNFMKQVEETKEHIGPYLNLYQVHSATFDSGILSNKAVHDALHECRVENGWRIGLSVSGSNQDEIIREAMKIQVANSKPDEQGGEQQQSTTRLFDSVQCTYNILEQRPAEALLEAHEAGMDIIIKEGLANGRVLRHPKLVELAKKLTCQPDALALGAILAQPFQPRVLSGAVTVEQLQSNLGALYPVPGVEGMLPSTSDGKEVLQQLMKECCSNTDEYWKARSDLKWN